jgi:uncharacterized membrane protein HdeD (DUF308 family)
MPPARTDHRPHLERSKQVHAHASETWWTVLLRGMAATVFGLVTLTSPDASLPSLVTAFGAYTVIDGLLILVGLLGHGELRRGLLTTLPLSLAAASFSTGAVALAWPDMTRLSLAHLIVSRLLTIGVLENAMAIPLRRLVQADGILALAGLGSVLGGSLFAAFSGPHELAWISWTGGWAALLGLLLILLGVRLHHAAIDASRMAPITQASGSAAR